MNRSPYHKATVVVTGASGQLGQFLIKYFQDNYPEFKVIGTIRHKSYDNQEYIFDRNKVILELMDLSDSHSIENLIIKYKPQYFINTAANAFVGESWAVPLQHLEQNCVAVLHQLEAIRKHSPTTRYFNMGTSEELGCNSNDGKFQDEDTVIAPKSPYGCSKAAARYLVDVYRKSYDLYALQGWTFNFESELRGEKYVTRKITKGVARIYHALKSNKDFEPLILGNLESYRSWQFCGDVADGIWRMLNQEMYNDELLNKLSGYPYYISREPRAGAERHLSIYEDIKVLSKHIKNYVMSAPKSYSIREFIQLAFAESKIEIRDVNRGRIEPVNDLDGRQVNYALKDGRPVVVVSREFYRPSDVTYLNGSAARISKDLGWKPTLTFPQLVERMIKYDIDNFNKS